MRLPTAPAQEACVVWALTLLALAIGQGLGILVPQLSAFVGALAVAAFLWVPQRVLEVRGQDAHDVGLHLDGWRRDLAWGVGACVVILPLFSVVWLQWARALPGLPAQVRALLAPYASAPHELRWDFLRSSGSLELLGRIAGNGAVALAEEFFYRGYLTLRLEERWPPKTRILGATMGLGAVIAAVLFALGHLLVPAPFRLAVFFPALLFAWLRARTGTVIGAAVCHWLCNVCLLLLERAAF